MCQQGSRRHTIQLVPFTKTQWISIVKTVVLVTTRPPRRIEILRRKGKEIIRGQQGWCQPPTWMISIGAARGVL